MCSVVMSFKRADPVTPEVVALHVLSSRVHGVAIHGLILEGVSPGGPVAEVAGFKVEVERAAVLGKGESRIRVGL